MLIDPVAAHAGDPRAIAIVTSRGDETTYEALDAEITEGAARLRHAGLAEGHAVVVAPKAPREFVVGALAALRVGAVVVPADPRAPEAAVRALAARAGAALLVTDGASDFDAIPTGVAHRVHAARTSLLLSTSGSSAAPKLVALGGEGIVANVRAILDYLPVARAAVTLPLSYSYGLVGQVLVTLCGGGTLLLLGDVAFSSAQVERMRSLGAEGLSTVPTQLRALLRVLEEEDATLPLTYVASAGAACDADTIRRARARFGGATLMNQYGLTEASPRVTAIADADPRFAEGSVGRPIRGMEVRAVDAAGAMLGPGQEGSLEVRGPSVMLGYLDDEEATARAISGGWLTTGDAGHVDADGYVWVTGRRDGVVKCAGERVSVEEIAATLRDGGAPELTVVAIDHAELGAELWAFVEGEEAAIRDLRARAKERLSPAKRPSQIVSLAALPRTQNGKLDLGALRAEASRRRAERGR